MSSPKFKVGEQVVLQSKTYPKFNGDYIVERILVAGASGICRISGERYHVTNKKTPYTYLLNTPLHNPTKPFEIVWAETALSKKHKPSDQSFDQIMSSLKQPQKV